MKRLLIIILGVFLLSYTAKASNNLEIKIPTNDQAIIKTKHVLNLEINTTKKDLKTTVFRTQVVTTFTDDCGSTWQVTTTCDCSIKDAYEAQADWINSHMDDSGCLHPSWQEV